MSNKMLIDAAHPEETRVVVLKGNRVEDFDFESASKKPLRGNIYLAKVTRVEPSLQAAFVEYGGNRHGFLAFSEIHPDYYQIPVADRQALLEEEARAHREEDDEQRGPNPQRKSRRRRGGSSEKRATSGDESVSEAVGDEENEVAAEFEADSSDNDHAARHADAQATPEAALDATADEPGLPFGSDEHNAAAQTDIAPTDEAPFEAAGEPAYADEAAIDAEPVGEAAEEPAGEIEHEPRPDLDPQPIEMRESGDEDHSSSDDAEAEEDAVEQLGGDALEDVPYRAPRLRRHYKIQEVIKRRQILLVQVVKEERGNKGAALTTYLSLAGRYSVLMPNTARGGGISRKITDSDDRKRLKSIAQDLEVPEGMGIILRTAGASRSESEVKRDFEYLLRMWETIRELTLRSTAPSLVYEEGSLIKRAIRDLFSREMEEVLVSGDTAYREAKEFMRLLMPSHAKFVRPYSDQAPIFAKSGVEAQLDAMFSNHVTLRSGGYIVINQTEALVAIDVNSGRSTREHNIEDTALRTNLEAADEVARQLRLRDLAGLIVVDFIDMEEGRNNRAVERRMKDALKNDRARIQIGRISHFGLLEMSRQRIRTGVLEGSTVLCPHCAGAGTVRSVSSIALHVLRILEDTLIRSADFNLIVRTRTEVALYILNQKRAHLSDLEQRFGVTIAVMVDGALTGTVYHAIERGEPATPPVFIGQRQASPGAEAVIEDEDEDLDESFEEGDEDKAEQSSGSEHPRQSEARGEGEGEGDRRRRRRRRRRGRDRDSRGSGADAPQQEGLAEGADAEADFDDQSPDEPREEGENLEPADIAAEAPAGAVTADIAPAQAPAEEPALPEPAQATVVEEEASEAPRRRRSRRAPRAAETADAKVEVAGGEPAAEEAPAPRRSRRTRARATTEETPSLLGFAPPSADRDVGAPIAHSDAAEAPAAASADVTPQAEATPAAPAPVPAATEAVAEAAVAITAEPPAEEPASSEPPRPKRSGWWQRAKATLTGE